MRQQWWIWCAVVAGAALHVAAALAARAGALAPGAAVWTQLGTAWLLIVLLAALASRSAAWRSQQLIADRNERLAARTQIEQLEIQNAILQTIAGSTDVTAALQALARRIERLVPCDRVGLALAKENGHEFETFTARLGSEERRTRLRPELEFPLRGTLIGEVVSSREPRVFEDLAERAADHLDANLFHSSGFRSVLLVPLVAKKRIVGTLNVMSRREAAFTSEHVQALEPIGEIIAVTFVAQQLQVALTRLRTTEAMAEVTLSVSNEISSALQTIVGHCDLLEREYRDPALQRDLATVVRQAQRIADLLERMRVTAGDRLRQVAAAAQVDEADLDAEPETAETVEPDDRR